MKKHLLSITDRQDIVMKSLSEEIEVSLSELFRRALDSYIDQLVEKGTLIRFKFSSADMFADIETPKEAYRKFHDYVKANPDGAIKLISE